MKPGYSITKGYPFDIVMSRDRFKHRPNIFLDHGKKDRIFIECLPEHYPTFRGWGWIQKLFAGKTIDFLLHRLFDYAEALTVSEAQIDHLLKDDPFVPEEFGFLKAAGPKKIHDNPATIYISKYDETVSLFREPGKNLDWVLIKRNDDSFHETKLRLANHRIAYASFYALNIKVEDDV